MIVRSLIHRVGGSCCAPETNIQRLTGRSLTGNSRRVDIEAVIGEHVGVLETDGVVSHVGHFEREITRQHPLDGEIPGLGIGYRDVGGDDRVILTGCVWDDAVAWNRKVSRSGKASG